MFFNDTCKLENQVYNNKIVLERKEIIYTDSSEYMRRNHKFVIQGGVGLFAGQVSVGYFLNSETVLQIDYQALNDIIVGRSEIKGVGLTRFAGNSLYIKANLAQRVGDSVDYKRGISGKRGTYHSIDSMMAETGRGQP